jgi:hypothetical protein
MFSFVEIRLAVLEVLHAGRQTWWTNKNIFATFRCQRAKNDKLES